MNDFQNNKLQTAKLLIRFFGIFGSLTELLIIFSIINFLPLFVFNTKNDNVYLFTVFITIIIYIIYVFTTQAINGRTYVQKIQKIFIFSENGKNIQLKDTFKRIISKLVVFLFWLIPWFILSFLISSKYNSDPQILPIIKLTLFFGLLSAPIIMIPIISNKKQTLYDYLSSTVVLVNYEEIKKEEREHINRLINDPFQIDKKNPNVSIQARIIAIIIFFILKIFKKKF